MLIHILSLRFFYSARYKGIQAHPVIPKHVLVRGIFWYPKIIFKLVCIINVYFIQIFLNYKLIEYTLMSNIYFFEIIFIV